MVFRMIYLSFWSDWVNTFRCIQWHWLLWLIYVEVKWIKQISISYIIFFQFIYLNFYWVKTNVLVDPSIDSFLKSDESLISHFYFICCSSFFFFFILIFFLRNKIVILNLIRILEGGKILFRQMVRWKQ